MPRATADQSQKPKYQQLLESLSQGIKSGRFQPGAKLPSESALVKQFSTSRITVGRALRELQQAGLVDRFAGSGTYVRAHPASDRGPLLFGLLIPDLGETEIFGPICQGIANASDSQEHGLLWGHVDVTQTKEEQAWQLCQQFIVRQVAGVFFAPLEYELGAEKANRRILAAFAEARIPVVLLDRRLSHTPHKNRTDIVGLNNRQAGYLATEHLIRHGCKHIGFLGHHGSAFTIEERMAGYKEALAANELQMPFAVSSEDEHSKKQMNEVDAFVCANDRIAGNMMHTFLSQGLRIPEDIRLVGIDDVRYASLLPVPLTTVRQPCREVGEEALRTMMNRIDRPNMPARDVLIDGELVVRRSCGAHLDWQPEAS
jgi:GntR family transcriptional regulator, arabinose operon transcriptional repressor